LPIDSFSFTLHTPLPLYLVVTSLFATIKPHSRYVVLGVEAAVARERAGAAASGGLGGKQLAVGGGKGRIATVEVYTLDT